MPAAARVPLLELLSCVSVRTKAVLQPVSPRTSKTVPAKMGAVLNPRRREAAAATQSTANKVKNGKCQAGPGAVVAPPAPNTDWDAADGTRRTAPVAMPEDTVDAETAGCTAPRKYFPLMDDPENGPPDWGSTKPKPTLPPVSRKKALFVSTR